MCCFNKNTMAVGMKELCYLCVLHLGRLNLWPEGSSLNSELRGW